MSYFNLRKRDTEAEAEPDEAEVEEPAETPEETDEEPEREQPATQHGPLLTGLFGPGRWLAAHFGMNTAWGVHIVAIWAVFFYGSWVAVSVITVWLAAVLVFVPREFKDRVSTRLEQRSRPTHATAPAELRNPGDREGALRLLHTVLGEAPGVHLRTVLAYLQEHDQWEGKEVADLRRHLEALGIPVRPKVKVDGTPTRGVLKADLDALPPIEETPPSPTPSPTV
jgi:hypothetical protein